MGGWDFVLVFVVDVLYNYVNSCCVWLCLDFIFVGCGINNELFVNK